MSDLSKRLTDAIKVACPNCVGVAVGNEADTSTWRIDFADGASDAERSQAAAVISGFNPAAPTVTMINAERDRRLASGFAYHFGDARGTHQIGTSPSDMKGWGEVSTYAGALLDSGDVETKIAIVTDTGPCEVTAAEWRAIEIAAAMFRQPIWARSFVLQALLPADYTNDAQWS